MIVKRILADRITIIIKIGMIYYLQKCTYDI